MTVPRISDSTLPPTFPEIANNKYEYLCFDVTKKYMNAVASCECTFESIAAKISLLAFPTIGALVLLEGMLDLFAMPFTFLANCCCLNIEEPESGRDGTNPTGKEGAPKEPTSAADGIPAKKPGIEMDSAGEENAAGESKSAADEIPAKDITLRMIRNDMVRQRVKQIWRAVNKNQ